MAMKFNSKLDDAVVDMLANDIAEKLGCEPAYDKSPQKALLQKVIKAAKSIKYDDDLRFSN